MDILESVRQIELDYNRKISALNDQIDNLAKQRDKELNAVRDGCAHVYSEWRPVYLGDFRQGVERGCAICANREFMSFERFLKEVVNVD
jgi:hypothetical protein